MIAVVYGPTGGQIGDPLMGGGRANVARRAREMGGVQVYVMFDDGAREAWTTGEVGGAWRRAWRREGADSGAAVPSRSDADGGGRARDGLEAGGLYRGAQAQDGVGR